MLSDVLSEGVDGLDHYLTDPMWRSDYDTEIIARAGVIRAAMDALRGMLDAQPETCGAIEAAIAGDTQELDVHIAEMGRVWHAATPPNLAFSPRDFSQWAHAAVLLLRAVDQHLVPLLPQVKPLLPHKDD
jgi:hypothetical protein